MFEEKLEPLLGSSADPVAAGWQLRQLAESVEGQGALLVEEFHGIKKYKLLNGIGVNLISVVKGKDEGGKGGKESNLPTGPKGQISMEIVSIGGKSTL